MFQEKESYLPYVKLWEELLVIPTYKVEKPDPNPIFYSGRAYQGAQGHVYPYPLMDRLTDVCENKMYKAVFLENRYVKVCILPEVGGRIFFAVDKMNNYDFLYHQHVIKPALIGMLGAWISGGVEWNFPHHHRATTFMPVDYTLKENPDNSKTVWIGEIELRHRMKWIVGLTLYPGKSYIEATVKLINRTPFAHSFLFWANSAVHANPKYQIIFPPDTEYATYHGKNQFSHWPISYETFNNVNYDGMDVSWWRNHPAPTSFFAWNSEEDFLAGYDHEKQAGTVIVADHHVIPGKKFFLWGNGPEGIMWEKILTETDGPYIELMTGAYSDNQPDYSWIQPYEVKTFKIYWYPIRQIGGVKKANVNAAVNLEVVGENIVRIGFNTTSEYKDAVVFLKSGEQVLFRQKITISPEKPFVKEVSVPRGFKDLEVSLFSSENHEIISYKPSLTGRSPMPEPVKPPPSPRYIGTVEELYLTGMYLEQFYNPVLEPYPYYEEALRRDPYDSRTNMALGLLFCKRGLFQEAEEKLNRAISRLTKNYVTPKDGEVYYYLGVALKAQEKYDEACNSLFRATWYQAWFAAAYYLLAEIACLKKDFSKALEFIDYSISLNMLNSKALCLKSTLLRKIGRPEDAEKFVLKVLESDPLDYWCGNELYLIKRLKSMDEATKELDSLRRKMRDNVQSYLELATDYSNCGFWDEAIDILTRLIESNKKGISDNPLIFYYMGFLHEKKGEMEKALKYYKLGERMPADYCFPFRLEEIDIFRHAVKNNPKDAKAHYYLGNLLYYHNRYEEAIKEWEKSRGLDDTFSIMHRVLGLAYAKIKNDIQKAITSLEKAIICNKEDPRLYCELDQLYEIGGVPPEKRLNLLEKNHEIVVKYDDALLREITLYIQLGRYDEAINILRNHHFHLWEGGGEVHDLYVDAYLLRGLEKFRDGRYMEALEDYKMALEYPENLEVARPFSGGYREPQIYYLIGTVYEALGDVEKSKSCYEKATMMKVPLSASYCYQGLAFLKLGFKKEADEIFDSIINTVMDRILTSSTQDFFTKFGNRLFKQAEEVHNHYLLGLAYLGKDNLSCAKVEFEKVLESNPYHVWAKVWLK
jgi:tetratricopeptide (TPR) repeat protein